MAAVFPKEKAAVSAFAAGASGAGDVYIRLEAGEFDGVA
jgi:hypothetical protein